jgi:hypothetical protein
MGSTASEEAGVSDVLLLARAAVSWLAAVSTVAAVMLLRADSDGVAPGWPVLLIVMALLAAVFWPMTASRRRLPAFAASLIGLQLAGHAFLLWASTGQLAHRGTTGLFCCPSTPQPVHAGVLTSLTANAGWLLLAVQTLLVLVLSVPLSLLHKASLALGQGFTGLVRAVLPAFSALHRLLAFTPATPWLPVRPEAPRVLGALGRHEAAAVRRRGPPSWELVPHLTLSLASGVGA